MIRKIEWTLEKLTNILFAPAVCGGEPTLLGRSKLASTGHLFGHHILLFNLPGFNEIY